MIKNIIFDIGDVLVRFMPEESVRYAGVPEDEVENVLNATVGSRWWTELDRGVMDEEAVIEKMIEETPEYRKEIRKFFDEGKDMLVEAFDYSEKWIDEFKSKGYKVYLLSNYPESYFTRHVKNQLKFADKTDGRIVSAFVKCIKPEPEIYRLLLDTYALKPEECVFIDDRQENINGAAAAGIKGILFKNYEDAKEKLKAINIDTIVL